MSTNTAQAEDNATLRWVTFFLSQEKYGINVMQVQEVLRVTEIAPVPGAPDYVLGIINLRGNVVTVIDTRQRFGLVFRLNPRMDNEPLALQLGTDPTIRCRWVR